MDADVVKTIEGAMSATGRSVSVRFRGGRKALLVMRPQDGAAIDYKDQSRVARAINDGTHFQEIEADLVALLTSLRDFWRDGGGPLSPGALIGDHFPDETTIQQAVEQVLARVRR